MASLGWPQQTQITEVACSPRRELQGVLGSWAVVPGMGSKREEEEEGRERSLTRTKNTSCRLRGRLFHFLTVTWGFNRIPLSPFLRLLATLTGDHYPTHWAHDKEEEEEESSRKQRGPLIISSPQLIDNTRWGAIQFFCFLFFRTRKSDTLHYEFRGSSCVFFVNFCPDLIPN